MRENLFQKSFFLFFLGLLMVVLVMQILFGATFLMYLPRPRAIIIGLLLAFSLLAYLAQKFSVWFTEKFQLTAPTVILWLIPLTSLFFIYLLMTVLLLGVHTFIHRAFWSNLANLNAKNTTMMFTTTFFAFKIYILIRFSSALYYYLNFWFSLFEIEGTIQEKTYIDENVKARSSRFNRFFFFFLFGASILLGTFIVFLKPETILYYRGEIQVQSQLNPEAALEIFNHLVRKYPNYAYLDTVETRAAWVLERRLKKYDRAIEKYREFLTKYGYQNVWADDVTASLSAIYLDKKSDPQEAIKWISVYEEHFPQGMMLPHLILYKIRALIQMNDSAAAKSLLDRSLIKFRGTTLILYDNDDNFVTTLPFEVAAKTLSTPNLK